MDKELAKYPFLEKAKEFVNESETTIKDLVEEKAFSSARERAKERVIGALKEGVTPKTPLEKKPQILKEVYSYPLSRIIVSCIDDRYLSKRYSLAEAKSFYSKIKKEDRETVLDIADNIGLNSVRYEDEEYKLHFTDYLKLTASLNERKWKLTNQKIIAGEVLLERNNFERVLQEGIRESIENNLPMNVPKGICESINQSIDEINHLLGDIKSTFDTEIKGVVKKELFPPCVKNLIKEVQSSRNISHAARFTLVSFMLKIGMSVDEIIDLFKVAPDFDEERTRYQIDHIGGRSSESQYTPPSCSTLKTYGLCLGNDWRCEKVSHPLGYYEWRVKSEEKDEVEN